MNILFICDEYPPGKNGGIGTVVQNLGRELVKQGHSIFVVGLYHFSYGEKNYEVDNGVRVWRLRYGVNLRLSPQRRVYQVLDRLPNVIKKKINGKNAFIRFINFIDELTVSENIDLIEIADFNGFAMNIGFIVKWPKFKVPLVLKSHGSYTYFCNEMGEKVKDVFAKADKLLFERADAISCVSNYTAKVNRQIFCIKKEIKILYNGINIPDHNAHVESRKKTVLFTGSLAYKKGIYSLIKAWNLVQPKFPDAELLIFGKGKTINFLNFINPEVKHSIIFFGHVNQTQLFDYLSKASLAVFPSYSETFGMGVVEAMSLNCPVIYTKKSCGPEIVKDRVEGFLVDPDNPIEIAQKIILLLENPSLRDELAKAGFEAVKSRFDIKKSAAEHALFYNEVISKQKNEDKAI